jgi:hypothetical protein
LYHPVYLPNHRWDRLKRIRKNQNLRNFAFWQNQSGRNSKKERKKNWSEKTVPFGGMGALKQNKNDELILSCLSLFLSSLFKWIFSEYFSN